MNNLLSDCFLGKVGWNSQPTRMVFLENCRIPEENLLGEEGQVSMVNCW